MNRAVFRPGELVTVNKAVSLDAPFAVEEDMSGIREPENLAPVFEGPTADDLRREAEDFKARWALEREAMLNSARSEAEVIVTDAKKTAAEEGERQKTELEAARAAAQAQADAIIQDANNRAEQLDAAAAAKLEEASAKAAAQGFEQGHKDGYEAGMTEVKRLITRTQLIMQRIQDKRFEVIEQAEQEIIDLAMLVARKVVKLISESQRQVVVENIKAALERIKTSGKVTVRVNLADLETATEHLDEFVKLMESSGGIHILEDSAVDQGGCRVETDFGEIDARIAVQFAELESKILDLSPIKKSDVAAAG
ncbi:MAG: flagellar assembly protein FliH [Spirochaetaceae bacterium]|jgi:flagellar assembly protein FliH|nr:flagellar assembly protein FliH [Spirochaetaceae bacterium]